METVARTVDTASARTRDVVGAELRRLRILVQVGCGIGVAVAVLVVVQLLVP